MKRRAYVASALAGVGSLAGCLGVDDLPRLTGSDGSTSGTADDATSPSGGTSSPGQPDEYPVPESEIKRGAPRDAIPAIVDPDFASDWSGLELEVPSQYEGNRLIRPRLDDGDEVLGIERGGEARAYPLRVLNWHEVCNDTFDEPLLATYCPLCRTGVAAVRRVDGEETRFGVSGLLWKSNLVMYDELTESRWSQVAATAIRGEKAGTRMDLVPSTITTWGEWRDAHPDTEVLVPPPESSTIRGRDATRNYERDPYSGYDSDDRVGIGRSEFDDRLHPKTIVLGISDGGVARAYPLAEVRSAGVVNDTVGELPVVVTVDAGDNLVAYERAVDGETLTFEADTEATIRGGGTTWRRSSGRAVDGSLEGSTLDRANDRSPMFWFSWADVYPDTEIFEVQT